jgi:hypothetical protein
MGPAAGQRGACALSPAWETAPTHVICLSDGALIASDGLRTYEQVPRWHVVVRWLSAGAGMAALLYLLLVGGVSTLTARCRTNGCLRSRPWRLCHERAGAAGSARHPIVAFRRTGS